MSSTLHRARRLLELSPRDAVTLVVAAASMRVAPVLLRRYGLQGLQGMLARRAPLAAMPRDPDDVSSRTAWLVATAARFGPARPNCLQRSVVLWWLLRRRGVDSEIRIGVRRRPESDDLDFHAWVEQDGVVLNDAPDLRQRFATFDRAIVPAKAVFD